MPSTFAHLKKYSVKGDTPRGYMMGGIGPKAVRLHFLPATKANAKWLNHSMRVGSDAAHQAQGEATPERVKQIFIQDARSFAECCLVGWDEEIGEGKYPNLDAKGKPVKFTEEKGLEFLLTIAEHVDHEFSKLRAWLITDENFVGESDLGN